MEKDIKKSDGIDELAITIDYIQIINCIAAVVILIFAIICADNKVWSTIIMIVNSINLSIWVMVIWLKAKIKKIKKCI